MMELVATYLKALPNLENGLYGVLWVEWVDGVAFRKAAGELYEEAWETHHHEEVDLVLG